MKNVYISDFEWGCLLFISLVIIIITFFVRYFYYVEEDTPSVISKREITESVEYTDLEVLGNEGKDIEVSSYLLDVNKSDNEAILTIDSNFTMIDEALYEVYFEMPEDFSIDVYSGQLGYIQSDTGSYVVTASGVVELNCKKYLRVQALNKGDWQYAQNFRLQINLNCSF